MIRSDLDQHTSRWKQVRGTTRCVKSHLVLNKNEITYLWGNWEKLLRNFWYAWDFSEICEKYQRSTWDVPEICLRVARDMPGIWYLADISLTFSWYIPEICKRFKRDLLDLPDVCVIPDMGLRYAWEMNEIYLRLLYVWKIPEICPIYS